MSAPTHFRLPPPARTTHLIAATGTNVDGSPLYIGACRRRSTAGAEPCNGPTRCAKCERREHMYARHRARFGGAR